LNSYIYIKKATS